jgi:hypothetical protein
MPAMRSNPKYNNAESNSPMIRDIVWFDDNVDAKTATLEKHNVMHNNPIYDAITAPRSIFPAGLPEK